MFVRNHDELTLDKLSDDERAEVFGSFGPDKDMQLYDRGLRRRLPPMVDGDRRRIELGYSLLFTLPGTPVLFCGEELGMGENLAAEGRQAVRTPMQGTPEKGAGFSTAVPDAFPAPLVEGAAFGPQKINVYEQSRDPGSLLSRMRLFTERYRDAPGLGRAPPGGDGGARGPGARLPRRRRHGAGRHNFADRPLTVRLKLSEAGAGGRLPDLLDEGHSGSGVPADGLFRAARLRLPVAPRRHAGRRPRKGRMSLKLQLGRRRPAPVDCLPGAKVGTARAAVELSRMTGCAPVGVSRIDVARPHAVDQARWPPASVGWFPGPWPCPASGVGERSMGSSPASSSVFAAPTISGSGLPTAAWSLAG